MTKKKKAEEIEQEIETPEENSSIEEETLNPVNQMEDEALEDIEENLSSEDEEDEEDETDDEDEDDKEMTSSEARDYVDEQIDDKFVSDCSKDKMTPEKAAKKIKELKEENKKYMTQIKVLKPLAEYPDLYNLFDFYKKIPAESIERMNLDKDNKENAKQNTGGVKRLLSIQETQDSIRKVRYLLSSNESSLKNNERRIKEIESQGFQLGMFDGNEEATAEEETVEQPTLADEVEEVEEEPAEI